MSPGDAGATVDDRILAPLDRRDCEVVGARDTGGYRVFTALDGGGPLPRAGQFYMLTADAWGSDGGRPYLPRAFSFAAARETRGGVALEFLLEAVGPGTERLAALEPGDRVQLTGPSAARSRPRAS